MYTLLLFAGCLAGITTVLFGFGGGFVIVPLLYAVLTATPAADLGQRDAAMHIAVATSTAVMVFGAGMATLRHHRAKTLPWHEVRPLSVYLGLGAIGGAAAALALSGDRVKWAFMAYLAVSLLDAFLRPGFMHQTRPSIRPMGRTLTAAAGLLIGCVSALLGVGGSVMTVPLMRRRGASMTAATAMASPLSLPMAVAGTATYMLLAGEPTSLGPWHAGHVDLRAFLALAAGSWLGIRLAAPWIGRIPDALHARVYLGLLGLILIVMLAL